jgi:hypothetical protein
MQDWKKSIKLYKERGVNNHVPVLTNNEEEKHGNAVEETCGPYHPQHGYNH